MPEKPESRIYIVPTNGGTPRLVTEHPNSYWHSWSPDGKTIVFTRPDHGSLNIYAISAEGGEERALTSGDGVSDDPDYSPDGKYIYFNSDRGGNMQIWRMRSDGSGPEQVTYDDLVNWTPHISPDGKSMVFLSYEKGVTGHPANKDVALRIMSMDDKKVTSAREHCWRFGHHQRSILGSRQPSPRFCQLSDASGRLMTEFPIRPFLSAWRS